MARDWTPAEVEATVADYFAMLQLELVGHAYNKTEHRRSLRRLLDDRTDQSVEYKHRNISAVLRDLGHPWIDGYKPLGNYQQLLYDVVASRLRSDKQLVQTVEARVDEPGVVPSAFDPAAVWDEPPSRERTGLIYEEQPPPRPRVAAGVDYLERETRNRSLGLAGEEFVLRVEAERLHRAGRKRLSNRIEHVSQTQGDGLGYDILSFEDDGRERLIEVKTTSFGKRTQFWVTRNELWCSKERDADYHLYRVFDFRKAPRLFSLSGALDQTCELTPIQYKARFDEG